MRIKVSIVGGGSWGSTVASLVAKNTQTLLWARNEETVREINENHSNEKYLPHARLTTSLKATDDLHQAAREADVLVMGVPSQSFRHVLHECKAYIRPWVPIISLSKGLELGTHMRMSQIIEDVMPGHPAGVLSGPNLAREVITGQAAASVIAMVDTQVASQLQKLFRTGLFRVYTNPDVIGCELGGALKNVIAIAAGMGDGAGAGDNTRAAVITRGLAELTRLGTAMGGLPSTFAGLAGMGDLVATCISPQSRNRHVGFQLGQGRSLNEIIQEMSMVAEGVKTVSVVMELAEKYQLEMPISYEVYKVVNEGNTVKEAFKGLLQYKLGSEEDPG